MKLEEKLKLFKDKGWTCNPDTGEVFSHTGRLITGKILGYIVCTLIDGDKIRIIKGHQLVWFLSTNKVPKLIDHINSVKTDNRLINLRDVETDQKNSFNRQRVKGYSFHKNRNRFMAYIRLNGKLIHLGYFVEEQEARQAYLDAKKIYHII